MTISIRTATDSDAAAIAGVLTAAADDLTTRFGNGHWSHGVSEAAALRALKLSTVLVAVEGAQIIGTLRLTTKKPWAIDAGYFTSVKRAIYLLDMSVAPAHQRRGIGRRLLAEARRIALSWPGQAIRLDAYDAEAGAGEFYERCGYREVGRVTYRGTPLVYYEKLLAPQEGES